MKLIVLALLTVGSAAYATEFSILDTTPVVRQTLEVTVDATNCIRRADIDDDYKMSPSLVCKIDISSLNLPANGKIVDLPDQASSRFYARTDRNGNISIKKHKMTDDTFSPRTKADDAIIALGFKIFVIYQGTAIKK